MAPRRKSRKTKSRLETGSLNITEKYTAKPDSLSFQSCSFFGVAAFNHGLDEYRGAKPR